MLTCTEPLRCSTIRCTFRKSGAAMYQRRNLVRLLWAAPHAVDFLRHRLKKGERKIRAKTAQATSKNWELSGTTSMITLTLWTRPKTFNIPSAGPSYREHRHLPLVRKGSDANRFIIVDATKYRLPRLERLAMRRIRENRTASVVTRRSLLVSVSLNTSWTTAYQSSA